MKRRYTPEIGLYFTYGGSVFKLVRIRDRFLYFAWYDNKLSKVLTTPLEWEGMSLDYWSEAVLGGRYNICNKTLAVKELREFKLEENVNI